MKISCTSDFIKASWLEHEDKESGIAMTEWCVESINNTCNVQTWQALPTNPLSKSAIIHSLSSLTSVRVVVRITNGVGNKAVLESTACIPVKSFPTELNVAEVNNLNHSQTDIDYQNDADAIVVMWSPNNVTSYSSIQAALTEPGEDLNISDSLRQKWSGEPLAYEFVEIPRERAQIRFTGDMIKPYRKYRSVIKRCNEGLCTDSFGDGVEIVPDAPPDIQVMHSSFINFDLCLCVSTVKDVRNIKKYSFNFSFKFGSKLREEYEFIQNSPALHSDFFLLLFLNILQPNFPVLRTLGCAIRLY